MTNRIALILIATALPALHALGAGTTHWIDLSTTEDGISPAECTDAQKQCVFRNTKSMQEITSVAVRVAVSGVSELGTYAEAETACHSLANWGGHSDWRLPTAAELIFHKNALPEIYAQHPFLGKGDHFFWSQSRRLGPDFLPAGFYGQDPNLIWAVKLAPYGIRQLQPGAVMNFVCLRDSIDISHLWTDETRSSDGLRKTGCGISNDACIFRNTTDGVYWSSAVEISERDQQHASWAIKDCHHLRVGGYDDWRLPDLGELSSANQAGIGYLALHSGGFFRLIELTYLRDFIFDNGYESLFFLNAFPLPGSKTIYQKFHAPLDDAIGSYAHADATHINCTRTDP